MRECSINWIESHILVSNHGRRTSNKITATREAKYRYTRLTYTQPVRREEEANNSVGRSPYLISQIIREHKILRKLIGELWIKLKYFDERIPLDPVKIAVCECYHIYSRLPNIWLMTNVVPEYVILTCKKVAKTWNTQSTHHHKVTRSLPSHLVKSGLRLNPFYPYVKLVILVFPKLNMPST